MTSIAEITAQGYALNRGSRRAGQNAPAHWDDLTDDERMAFIAVAAYAIHFTDDVAQAEAALAEYERDGGVTLDELVAEITEENRHEEIGSSIPETQPE